ncbi:uncharacterized protein LOC116208172 isoform X2 [Punica granatum]|uniref:Uncharacterized protein LOC116208172 isoform X2 n=1 Tax=Punica granatum TaxID=22663 RepID=A0A6P8DSG7_PUNGR|nr:uncharacterized protein LOC116208172 isoform X2 [Punica granatum]
MSVHSPQIFHMAPDVKYGAGYSSAARNIGRDNELKRSSHPQQSSRKGKERILSPRGTETIKFPEKLKAENCLAPPFIHRHRERRQDVDDRGVHQKIFESRPRQPVKGMTTADDELVKHMSNLPAYLQRIDRSDNFQEKVLSVGVLDWTRLEKWKLNQKGDVKRGGAVTSSFSGGNKSSSVARVPSSLPTALSTKTPTQRSALKGPLNSSPCSFHKDGGSQYLKPVKNKVTHSQDCASVPKIHLDHDKKILSASSSSGRNRAQVTVGECGNRKDLSQEIDLKTVKSSAPVKKATGSSKADVRKTDQEGRNFADAGASSFSKLSRSGEQMGPLNGETKERVEKAQELDEEVSHQPRHRKQKSIVLLLPKRFPQSIPDVLKKNEKRIPSAPCSTEPNWSSFSDSFSSGELHSGPIFSEIPKSCPLPSQVAMQSETVSPTVEPASDELQSVRPFKYAKRHGSNSKAASLDLAAELKIGERESPEQEARRSRNSSPNRRFSFSLGRMTRSFSFKETTSVPQLGPTYISAKSGPVTNEDTSCGNISNQEKANSLTRGRSSPLRRLLDPLLKSRSMRSHHSAENIQPLKPVNPTGPLLHEKHEKFTVQALLQLTIKNGSPLFKFVVDNSSDVLAATVSNSVSARKDGSFRSCTFYSVNEIKKKSISWIGQGNKAKGGDFAYNVVGQMKLSSPCLDRTLKSLNQQIITTECVLFSVDSRQADKQPANSNPNKELAAIVFKISANENSDPNSVTVILPGGVHGVPDKGEPSPLIDRWKSGGSCDCGGWDVGCTLHMLSNQNICRKNANKLKNCSTSDHLELFAQGEAQSSRPKFSLTPFRKGIYSIEFDSSMSLLQAFSICVAFISCQGLPGSPEANCLSGVNAQQEPTLSRNGALKAPLIFQREGPEKYAPCPPLSPVGRV